MLLPAGNSRSRSGSTLCSPVRLRPRRHRPRRHLCRLRGFAAFPPPPAGPASPPVNSGRAPPACPGRASPAPPPSGRPSARSGGPPAPWPPGPWPPPCTGATWPRRWPSSPPQVSRDTRTPRHHLTGQYGAGTYEFPTSKKYQIFVCLQWFILNTSVLKYIYFKYICRRA